MSSPGSELSSDVQFNLPINPNDYALAMTGISKAFPGVQALDQVSLLVKRGEVHALVGENGAGKSTLMKILSGGYSKDSGTIYRDGKQVEIRSPADAQAHGVTMVHQELNLIPQMNAAQNIFLGREPGNGPLSQFLRLGQMRDQARELIGQLGAAIDVNVPIRRLSIAQRQMVEIAKALSVQADVIVMDEPTSSLTDKEIVELFSAIRRLTARGAAIIFVSHRMEEIFEICDRVTVLRDGKTVGSRDILGLTATDVIQMMVGTTLENMYPKVSVAPGEEVIRVENLSVSGVLEDVHFTVRAGEILGIAGLVGAGRSEIGRALFGVERTARGRISYRGRPVRIRSPRDAIKLGIGLLTADRKEQGLVLKLPITVNTTLARTDKVSSGNILQRGKQRSIARDYVEKLHIRPGDIERRTRFLSGGNQQKVVIGKWLFSDARLLIFDEPTRGIDVGAKVEIYQLMNQLVADGDAIIMISSELPEIIGMADRILVMREGRIVSAFERDAAHQWQADLKEQILQYAMGKVRND